MPMGEGSSATVLADRYRVSGGYGRELPAFARSYGIDIAPIAAALGLDLEAFQDPQSSISLNRFCRLFEVLATIAGDPTFGLKYSQVYVPGGSGPFEYGIMHAPTLRDALEFFVKYIGLQRDVAYLGFDLDQRHCRIEWSLSPLIVQREQFVDFIMASNLRFLAHFGDPARLIQKAEMERREPTAKVLYRQLISPHIEFNAPINGGVISAQQITAKNEQADERLFLLMQRQCDAMLRERAHEPDLILRLKEEILSFLSEGNVAIGFIARRLAMSERSLQRRLAERGTSFHDLLDETRREYSDRLLRETDLSLSEISYRLGFSAPSAYSRSSQRWYGKTPSAARETWSREMPALLKPSKAD